MTLKFSGTAIANVNLSDTFNTWRVRFNEVVDASSADFEGNVTAPRVVANTAGFAGLVTGPRFTANTLTGTLSTAAQANITSLGTLTALTTGQITGQAGGGFASTVTAPRFTANTLTGTISTAAQANITSLGTLTALTTGQITGQAGAGFASTATAPRFTANTLTGTISTAAQANITSLGTLTALTTGQITGQAGADFASTATAPRFTANTLTGTLSTAAQANITSLGTLSTLTVGTSAYFVANGNVGVATSAPGSKLDVKGTLRLSGSSSGYVGFAPAASAGSVTYTLPSADGSSGQSLQTNGSATLTWASGVTTGKSIAMAMIFGF